MLACCGVVEVLRLYAPSPPYSPDNLGATFSTISDRLAVLKQAGVPGNEVSVDRALSVLDSLVRVRSCVVVVELGDAVAIPFFAALLGAML